MAVRSLGNWTGTDKYLTDDLYVSPIFVAYGDVDTGAGLSYLTLPSADLPITAYTIRLKSSGHTSAELQNLLPIYVEFATNTSAATSRWLIPATETAKTWSGFYYVSVKNAIYASLVIPKDGSAFTITTTIKTNYQNQNGTEKTYTFTQQGYGTETNGLTGETELLSRKIYTYSTNRAFIISDEKKMQFSVGYSFWGNVTPGGYPYPVAYMDGTLANGSYNSISFALIVRGTGTNDEAAPGTVCQDITIYDPYVIPSTTTYKLEAGIRLYFQNEDFTRAVIHESTLKLTSVTSRSETDTGLKPIITNVTRTSDGGHTAKYGGFVQNKTTAGYQFTVQFKYGDSQASGSGSNRKYGAVTADIYTDGRHTDQQTQSTTGSGISAYITFIAFGNAVSIRFKVKGALWGTDSDEYVITEGAVFEYHTPVLYSFGYMRCTRVTEASSTSFSYGGYLYEPDENGEYIRINLAYNISPLNNANSKTVRTLNPDRRDITWVYTLPVTVTLSSYVSDTSFFVYPAEYEARWSFNTILRLTDDFESSPDYSLHIDTMPTVMDYPANGNGLAIGKMAERLDLLDIASAWTLLVYNGTFLIGGYHEDTGSDQELTDWMRSVEEQLYRLDGRLF